MNEQDNRPSAASPAAMASTDNKTRARSIILSYTMAISLYFLAAVPIALWVTGETDFWAGFARILISPSKLVTDYFALGGLAPTLFNAALLGFAANLLMCLFHVRSDASTFAAYMLVVAHGFYGLNILNMWFPLFGVMLYCRVMRRPLCDNLHVALFSTALGPFVSEFIFHYFSPDKPWEYILGVAVAALFGIASGFIVPALLPGTTAMHRGFNLYKAGLAIGLFGVFVYALLFRTLGLAEPHNLIIKNETYYALPHGHHGFMNVFFIFLFALTLLAGVILNHGSFKGYRHLLASTGYGTDFVDKFGMPVCLINIAVYGFCILTYLNLIFLLPDIFPGLPSVGGFTGATVGVVFAALTFAADGQQPRTVWPIVLGYVLLHAAVAFTCTLLGRSIPWSLSTQSYVNSLAFATGLCPFTGKYGVKVGIIAGILSAVICTSTAEMHGGLVLYNGGFNAGLTALILLPILDFYRVRVIKEDDK